MALMEPETALAHCQHADEQHRPPLEAPPLSHQALQRRHGDAIAHRLTETRDRGESVERERLQGQQLPQHTRQLHLLQQKKLTIRRKGGRGGVRERRYLLGGGSISHGAGSEDRQREDAQRRSCHVAVSRAGGEEGE